MQKYFLLIFYCTCHEILLLLIVEGGAIIFDALHQLLYLFFSEVSEYSQTSNISDTLVGNKIVDHTDAIGAALTGAVPITSSFST